MSNFRSSICLWLEIPANSDDIIILNAISKLQEDIKELKDHIKELLDGD